MQRSEHAFLTAPHDVHGVASSLIYSPQAPEAHDNDLIATPTVSRPHDGTCQHAEDLMHLREARQCLLGAHAVGSLPCCSTKAVRCTPQALKQPVRPMSPPSSAG